MRRSYQLPSYYFLDSSRAQIASIISSTSQPQVSGNLSRPAQITLSTAPLLTQTTVGTTYHVPRGPAVVANLAAPRSNVTTVRTPLVVTAQSGQVHGIYYIFLTCKTF